MVAAARRTAAQDAHVGAAAAEVDRHARADLRLARVRVALQQRLGAHHHAGDAVAALGGLLVDEGALHRAGGGRGAEAFDRAHLAAFGGGERQ